MRTLNPPGDSDRRQFWLTGLKQGGIWWEEVRNTAKYLTMHSIAPDDNYLAKNVNNAEVEKSCSIIKTFSANRQRDRVGGEKEERGE